MDLDDSSLIVPDLITYKYCMVVWLIIVEIVLEVPQMKVTMKEHEVTTLTTATQHKAFPQVPNAPTESHCAEWH